MKIKRVFSIQKFSGAVHRHLHADKHLLLKTWNVIMHDLFLDLICDIPSS